MNAELVRRETATEYFKELVEGALEHQGVAAHELTSFYVVQLLTGFVRRQNGDAEPLAFQLAQVLQTGGAHQRTSLKQIGDVSLFLSGFFADSLRRKLVDI